MTEQESATDIDFERRTSRSHGRSGRTYVASAKVTRQEQMELERAARGEGKALSEWCRGVLLQAARHPQGDAVFTELVATRMLLVNLIKPLILGEKVSPTWITEAMTMVRKDKYKAARDVMQQYTANAGKEQQ
jgi:hypothetical protein